MSRLPEKLEKAVTEYEKIFGKYSCPMPIDLEYTDEALNLLRLCTKEKKDVWQKSKEIDENMDEFICIFPYSPYEKTEPIVYEGNRELIKTIKEYERELNDCAVGTWDIGPEKAVEIMKECLNKGKTAVELGYQEEISQDIYF